MHAAYMAAQLEPDVIKVKMPTDTENLENIVKAACGIPVVFSGGPYVDTEPSDE
jgi:DhnA family fructose-bisphosphate aldolase class Ia